MSRLKHAPLQEVIFELRWDLEQNEQGVSSDPEFDFALGRFKKNAHELGFKHYKNRFSGQLVLQALPQQSFLHQPVHQFWQDENVWPLLQFGPGVLTFNETDANYDWEDTYLKNIQLALDVLESSYDTKLNFSFASIRFIDSIKVNDYAFENWASFIQKNLDFEVRSVHDRIGKLKRFHHEQIFDCDDNSSLHFVISNGYNAQQEELLIWQTAVDKNQPFDRDSLFDWLETSHDITSKAFKEICKKDFYDSFNK